MRMVWIFILLCLAGCKQLPPPAQPSEVFLQIGSDSYLRLELPPGWTEQAAASGQRSYYHKKQGRLVIQDLGTFLRKQWLGQLRSALANLPDHPQQAKQLLQSPMQLDREPDYNQLRQLLAPLRSLPKDPKTARRPLQILIDYVNKNLPADDLSGRIQDNFSRRGYSSNSQTSVPMGEQQGALVFFGTSAEMAHGLYFLSKDHLVGMEVFASPRERAGVPAFLSGLAATIALDVPRPGDAQLTGPSATPQVAMQPMQGRHHSPALDWLAPWLPVLVFLFFTSLPAYLGARGGYASAQMTGGNLRLEAASGAFTATFLGIVCAGLISIALAWYWALGAPGGSGVMTPLAASMFFTVIVGLLGVAAAAVGGGLAALGAYLGASLSGRTSAILAALLAALGVVATPFILGAMGSSSRRHSSLPPPPRAWIQSDWPKSC